LGPDLLFRLLAVAEGYTPAFLPKQADPAAGAVSFTLTPHDLDKRDPALVLKGRVLDENGRPVAEAVVEPFGFGKGDGTQFGGLKGFDPLAVTNKKGEFRLGVPEPGVAVYVQATAPFKAPRRFKKLEAGPKPHDLTLFDGVTITGRLVKGGKPLAGVAVGAAQKERNVETFVGEFQAATDDKGVFQIRNVPAEDSLVLYGLMSSLGKHGAVGARAVRTGKSGSVSAVGDVEVKPGHKLSGRVALADGKPVPAGTRVMLSREEAWDSAQAVVDKEGRFSFAGLPPEQYSLTVNVKGYHLSPKNVSTDLLNGFRLLGVVREDIAGLRLLLEPGPEPEREQRSDAKFYEEYNRCRLAPLRGAPEEKQRR
jgi:hypothetical protein